MQVILTEDVSKLGEMGEIVNVKPGYGRNFLIPQGLAIPATTGNQKELDFHLKSIEKRKSKQRAAAQSVLSVLESVSFSIAKKVQEGDTLYGSVSEREIADALTTQTGQEVHRKQVSLDTPITDLGIYGVKVKLASGVFATTRLWVVAM